MRGLAEPRCPEWRFAFTWAELSDARPTRHPWLFEHRRGRNVRSFVATYGRTPFAGRFWAAVTPADPVHVGRLVVYWAVASGLLKGVLAIGPVRLAIDMARADATRRAGGGDVRTAIGNFTLFLISRGGAAVSTGVDRW